MCGETRFVAFANFCGLSVPTVTDLELLTAQQPAHKIPENLTTGSFELERARAILESCEIFKKIPALGLHLQIV